MADFDFKAAAPSRALPPGSFLFGAASQAQEDPSVYPITRLQRALVQGGHIGFAAPRAWSNALASFGIDCFSNPGTLQERSPAAAIPIPITSPFTATPRIGTASAASAGSTCQFRTNSNKPYILRGNAMGVGGFRCYARWGFSDQAPVATAKSFIGLTTDAGSIGNITPSSRTNIIGVGADASEANFSLMHNDGSGSATKISLGANYPANTSQVDIYALTLMAPANASAVDWMLERFSNDMHTPDFTTSGSISTDLPSAMTGMQFHFWRGNDATALEVAIDLFGYIQETGGAAF